MLSSFGASDKELACLPVVALFCTRFFKIEKDESILLFLQHFRVHVLITCVCIFRSLFFKISFWLHEVFITKYHCSIMRPIAELQDRF